MKFGENIPSSLYRSGHNELFLKDGELRPIYRGFEQAITFPLLTPPADLVECLSASPLGDRIRIFPIPLILSQSEHDDVLRAGAEQRALTLQRAFIDCVLGDQSWLNSQTLEIKSQIKRLFSEDGYPLDFLRTLWQGKSPDEVRFIYGPDCNRNQDGGWVVTEDNIGRIGAIGDTHAVNLAYCEMTGLKLNRDPVFDLQAAIEKFISDLGYAPTDAAVMGIIAKDSATPRLEPRNLENTRRLSALQNLGVRTVFFGELTATEKEEILSGKIKVLVNFDIRAWNPKKEFFQKIFRENGTHCFEAPGIKVMGSKRLLPFMDEMIRFFTGSKPILPTQESYLMQDLSLPADAENWVLKEIGKCSGDGIYIFSDMTSEQKSACLSALQDKASIYHSTNGAFIPLILQRKLNPGFLSFRANATAIERFNVELRPFVYVTGENSAHTGKAICAMVVPNSGDSRNSINRGAYEALVLSEEEINYV